MEPATQDLFCFAPMIRYHCDHRFELTLGVVQKAIKATLFINVHENELETALMSAHPSNRCERYRQWSDPGGHIDKELAEITWRDDRLALDSASLSPIDPQSLQTHRNRGQ